MSYGKVRQIDKGVMRKYIGKDEKKFAKKCKTKRTRNSKDHIIKYQGWCT